MSVKEMNFMMLINPYSFESHQQTQNEQTQNINDRISALLKPEFQPDNQNQNQNSEQISNENTNTQSLKDDINKNANLISYLLFSLATIKTNNLILPDSDAEQKRHDLYLQYHNLFLQNNQLFSIKEAEKVFNQFKDVYKRDD